MRLDPASRRVARSISAALFAAADVIESGEEDPESVVSVVRRDLEGTPGVALEYAERNNFV